MYRDDIDHSCGIANRSGQEWWFVFETGAGDLALGRTQSQILAIVQQRIESVRAQLNYGYVRKKYESSVVDFDDY